MTTQITILKNNKEVKMGTVFKSKIFFESQSTLCPICRKRLRYTNQKWEDKDFKGIEGRLQHHLLTNKACIRQQKLNELLD